MTDLILTEEDYRQMVMCEGSELFTTSLKVADSFEKKHKNVLRSIDNLECSPKFRRLNFEPSTYIDERGKVQRYQQGPKLDRLHKIAESPR